MTCILPHSFSVTFTRPAVGSAPPAIETRTLAVPLGGRAPHKSVLLFDNDGRFPFFKLQRMLLCHVRRRIDDAVRRSGIFDGSGTLPWKSPTDQELAQLANDWIARVHAVRPKSQDELRYALKRAKKSFAVPDAPELCAFIQLSALQINGERWCANAPSITALIVVDSLSAFWWEANEGAEADRPANRNRYAALAQILRELKQIQDHTGSPMLLVNQGVLEETPDKRKGTKQPPPNEAPLPGGKWWAQHLPCPPYSSIDSRQPQPESENSTPQVDFHITLQATLPQALPSGTRESAARANIAMREQMLERLQIVGWLKARNRGYLGKFAFRVGDEALDVVG